MIGVTPIKIACLRHKISWTKSCLRGTRGAYLQKEGHSHRLKLRERENGDSFSLWTKTYTVADGPDLQHHRTRRYSSLPLTANLQDGLILYNISHSHSISTRVKSNQEAQHNAVPLIQEIYMTLKSVAKNHMTFMEAPISYRTCTWHSCTVNSLPSVDISDAYK